MAAALAASLPAPQTAPTPSAPTYEAIPASMAQVIDIEAEIHITSVQLDAIVSSSRPFYGLDTAAVPSAPGELLDANCLRRASQARGHMPEPVPLDRHACPCAPVPLPFFWGWAYELDPGFVDILLTDFVLRSVSVDAPACSIFLGRFEDH